MAKAFLGDRERALEDEFFHRVDQELREKIREKVAREHRVDELREATGIQDDDVLRELVDLEIGADSLLALRMYPLVAVAWADGTIETREREAVLSAAGQVGCGPETPGYHLLEVWLDHQPGESVHKAWQDYVHALCEASGPSVKQAIENEILPRARQVAEAAGGILGFHKVSDSEEAALEKLVTAVQEA